MPDSLAATDHDVSLFSTLSDAHAADTSISSDLPDLDLHSQGQTSQGQAGGQSNMAAMTQFPPALFSAMLGGDFQQQLAAIMQGQQQNVMTSQSNQVTSQSSSHVPSIATTSLPSNISIHSSHIQTDSSSRDGLSNVGDNVSHQTTNMSHLSSAHAQMTKDAPSANQSHGYNHVATSHDPSRGHGNQSVPKDLISLKPVNYGDDLNTDDHPNQQHMSTEQNDQQKTHISLSFVNKSQGGGGSVSGQSGGSSINVQPMRGGQGATMAPTFGETPKSMFQNLSAQNYQGVEFIRAQIEAQRQQVCMIV